MRLRETSASVSGTPLRRCGGFDIWSTLLGALAAVVMSFAAAQPLVTMFAYSRSTLPGIPGDQQGTQQKNMFPPKYYLYVEVKQGSLVSPEWAWVGGRYYDCTLKKVKTPVLVESDPGVPTDKKETLVPKTSSDVYRVILGNVKARTAPSDQEGRLIADHEAVVKLVINSSSAYAAIQSITALPPAAAM